MNMFNYQNSTPAGPIAKQLVLHSFFFNVLPSNTNLFDECSAICVHLSPREEESTSSY